jgi:hypothetical protein
MDMLSAVISDSETEASQAGIGQILQALNDSDVDNNDINSIAQGIQGALKEEGGKDGIMGLVQQVAASGQLEELLRSDQIAAIAERAGVSPDAVKMVGPLVAQMLSQGSTSSGQGLLDAVLGGDDGKLDMGDMMKIAGNFMS